MSASNNSQLRTDFSLANAQRDSHAQTFNWQVLQSVNWAPFNDKFTTINNPITTDDNNVLIVESPLMDYQITRTIEKFNILPNAITSITFSCDLRINNDTTLESDYQAIGLFSDDIVSILDLPKSSIMLRNQRSYEDSDGWYFQILYNENLGKEHTGNFLSLPSDNTIQTFRIIIKNYALAVYELWQLNTTTYTFHLITTIYADFPQQESWYYFGNISATSNTTRTISNLYNFEIKQDAIVNTLFHTIPIYESWYSSSPVTVSTNTEFAVLGIRLNPDLNINKIRVVFVDKVQSLCRTNNEEWNLSVYYNPILDTEPDETDWQDYGAVQILPPSTSFEIINSTPRFVEFGSTRARRRAVTILEIPGNNLGLFNVNDRIYAGFYSFQSNLNLHMSVTFHYF